MLDETLIALAGAAGTAVAAAAGTDIWASVRERLAGILGRGGGADAEHALARSDRAVAALGGAEGADGERRRRLEGVWQERFESLLEPLAVDDRIEVASQLRELIALIQSADGVAAGDGVISIGGNVDIRADGGSVSAFRMGTVNIGNPPHPGVE
ncbi:hypothetical protein AB0D83_11035 [Streptomyces decoyicus]|uniref:hypothetical protein n=1 Tax=Streptomyces decoyicus TaxID=249567 RepID=UPI0033E66263